MSWCKIIKETCFPLNQTRSTNSNNDEEKWFKFVTCSSLLKNFLHCAATLRGYSLTLQSFCFILLLLFEVSCVVAHQLMLCINWPTGPWRRGGLLYRAVRIKKQWRGEKNLQKTYCRLSCWENGQFIKNEFVNMKKKNVINGHKGVVYRRSNETHINKNKMKKNNMAY